MLQRQAHSLLEKPIAGLIRSAHSGDNMGPVPFPGGEASFVLPLSDKGNGEVDLVPLLGSGPATFTRATTATTVLSNGLIGSVASGVPRSWYWPNTLAYGGYLAEGARTNLCLQSEDLATTWANNGSTESVNATTSPDGATTADKLVEDSANSQHLVSQDITFTNVVHSFSVWAKPSGRDWFRLVITDGTTVSVASFNVSTGTVGTQSNCAGSIYSYPNGWYRCAITTTAATLAAAGSVQLQLASADNTSSYQGDGASGMFFWGAQLEAASFASSYIPTTTASVTRNADVLTYTFSGNADATQGTAYAELGTQWSAVPSGINSVALQFGNDTAGWLYCTENDAPTVFRAFDGPNQATKSGLTSMATASRKRAASWGSGISVTGDGAAVATAAFDGGFGNTVILSIGNAGGGSQWFGPIKNIRLWKTQVAGQNLQLMTR